VAMKIGFTINLGNYESMRVDSSEVEDWKQGLAEIVDFLGRLEDKNVKRFTKWLLAVRVSDEEHSEVDTEL